MSSDGPDSVYDVEFRAVTKRFGDLTAVNAVSFQVRKGEFLSLLGPVRLRQDDVAADDRRLRAARRGRDPDRRRRRGRHPAVPSATSTPSSSSTRCSRT